MKNKQPKVIFIIFALIGLGLLFSSIKMQINDINFSKTTKETVATITDIDSYYDGEDTSYRVFVEFEVNGKEYRGQLDYYSYTMHVGGTAIVLYDSDYPQNFRSKSGNTFGPIMLAIIGLPFFLFGFIPLFNQGKKNKQKAFLMQYGNKVIANITDIVEGKIKINDRPCLIIICQYDDEEGGFTYTYKSENIWVDIPRYNGFPNYPPIAVYVDNADWKKYYVDVDNWLMHKI